MILLIITLVIIFLLWLFLKIVGTDEDFGSLVGAEFCAIAIIVLINAIVGDLFHYYEVTTVYEQKQYNIIGLENKTSQEFYLDGEYRQAFFIGYGSVHGETNTEMNYYYFKENDYGRILESCPANETYIREKDDIVPSLIWIVEERLYKGHPKLHKWFFLVEEQDKKEGIKIGTILEVPLNTIKIEYNVDV